MKSRLARGFKIIPSSHLVNKTSTTLRKTAQETDAVYSNSNMPKKTGRQDLLLPE